MDYVLFVLALPLFLISLSLTVGRRRHFQVALAPEAVASAWFDGRLLPWLFVAGLFLAVFLGFDQVPGGANLVRLIALSRYGVLTGLLLAGFVPLALLAAPSLLANLLVLRSPRQLFHVAWIAVLVGTMVVVVCRVEELNAPRRYGTTELDLPLVPRGLARDAALLLLCLPVPLACLRFSREAYLPPGGWHKGPWLVGGLGGLAVGITLVILATTVQLVLLSASVTAPDLFPLQSVGQWLWEQLGSPTSQALFPAGDLAASLLNAPGYTVPGPDGAVRLAPGHAQAALGMSAVLLAYVGNYLTVLLLGLRPLRANVFPALFLLLLLLLLLGFFLQGLAFALDRYWIPASVAVALFSFVLYQFTHTDHLFDLAAARTAGPKPAAPPTVPHLNQVAAAWQLPRVTDSAGPQRTLVAVTAAGGGIQAAAWTARVLVGLHELYGDNFTRSICLLSAVSGGSVGALNYLDRWQRTGSPLLPADWQYPTRLPAAQTICGGAMASSLEATAWGLVFPDLLRILFPIVVRQADDRGARIEEAWRAHLAHPGARLTDWIAPIRAGEMPVPIFNATVVETGQRFLASPVLCSRQPPNLPPAAQPRQLFDLYLGTAPLASTMVRLSATFPFVSPICRPERPAGAAWPESNAYHFADGGYVDNEGMITVIEWLTALLDQAYLPTRTFDRILLVRLMPFPSSHVAPAELQKGWFYSTWGPIEALQNVRTASQQERNELAVDFFTESAARQGVPVRSVALRFELPSETDPPLSWMLTDPQKAAIDDAWQVLADWKNPGQPLREIDALFPRVN
jgi:hypothetical protein